MMKKSKAGFTLAEVLTTLMVIGVVAAMTVPTLMNSTDDAQQKSAYKKAVSVIGQAAQILVAKEEQSMIKSSAGLTACMKKALSGTVVSEGGVSDTSGKGTVIQTADGLAYQFIYRANNKEEEDNYRNLAEACGGATAHFGTSSDSWSGKKAKCLVVVDVNGLGKGARKFTNATANESSNTDVVTGSTEQFPLILTGDGVRPIYSFTNSSNTQLRKGYQFMYGDKAVPNTTTYSLDPDATT